MNVVASAQDHFVERDACFALLEQLSAAAVADHARASLAAQAEAQQEDAAANLDLANEPAQENVSAPARALEEAQAILEKYQEQSHLLDGHLERMITILMDAVKQVLVLREADRRAEAARSPVASFPFQVYRNEGLQLALKALYVLCKVRGYKSVVKHLPHEVADLEPTLWLLQCQDAQDYATWETRYALLLWLSMLALIPFDLESVDSSHGSAQDANGSLVSAMTDLCTRYLDDPGPTREAAATCLARLLTRPDMESQHLGGFMKWAADALESVHARQEAGEARGADAFLVTGVFQALVEVFKHGHREKLLQHTSVVFGRVLRVADRTGAQPSALERKLTAKLVQRAGLNFLPPKVVTWRYQRGQRSLLANMAKSSSQKPQTDEQQQQQQQQGVDEEEEEEEHDDIPQEMEDVIEKLLCGLRDRDTIVRWSAAKGVGRVTSRLPEALADDVVAFVLELFDASEGDAAWHGGCLALAELARRGLLLPKRLGAVVPLVAQALVYDVRRGHNSVGANVRDAACYVCWAFARAYDAAVMRDHVPVLCATMLVTAVFDREVNCRRAASAAFQENVGRQGHENFPHGIEILTAADYFALGVRRSAFLRIAPFIAKFDMYRRPLARHLVDRKLSHWDLQLRTLAAEALGALAPADPRFMAEEVLPELLPRCLSPDMLVRHGATLGAAELVAALARVPWRLADETRADVRNTVMRIEKARLYRGRGGEWMRVAVCQLIRAVAQAGHALSGRAQLRLLDSVDESLKHPKDEVKTAAVEALAALADEYFTDVAPDAAPGSASSSSGDDGADALFAVAETLAQQQQQQQPGAVEAALSELRRLRRPALAQAERPAAPEAVARLVDVHCVSLEEQNPNPAVRRGAAMALGVLPARVAGASAAVLERVLATLVAATRPEENPELRDAETRRNAVQALGQLVETVGVKVDGVAGGVRTALLTKEQVARVVAALLAACDDYETDNRGDVGSWVRVVALESLLRVVRAVRTFPERVLRETRRGGSGSESNGGASEVLLARELGQVHVLRRTAGGAVVWVQAADGALHKLNAAAATATAPTAAATPPPPQEPQAEEQQREVGAPKPAARGFMLPAESEREACFLQGAGAKALESVMSQMPVPGLGRPSASVLSAGFLDPRTMQGVVCAVLKQLSEKMGAVRDSAGAVLVALLAEADAREEGVPLPIAHLETLRDIFQPDPRAKAGDAGQPRATDEQEQGEAAGDEGEGEADQEEKDVERPEEKDVAAEQDAACNWKAEAQTFPRVCRVLALDEYAGAALSGLVLSVGDLTESVSKSAAQALLDWCAAQKASGSFAQLTALGRLLADALEAAPRDDRVVVPVLKTLHLVMDAQVLAFDKSPRLAWVLRVHDAVRAEMRGSGSVAKLVACARLMFPLAAASARARPVALASALVLLGHKFPRVRMTCAKELNLWALAMDGAAVCGTDGAAEAEGPVPGGSVPAGGGEAPGAGEDLLDFLRAQSAMHEAELLDRPDARRPPLPPGFDPERAFEEAQDVVAETPWETAPLAEARAQRDRLYALLRVAQPAARKPVDPEAAAARAEARAQEQAAADDSYATLIHNREMGY